MTNPWLMYILRAHVDMSLL